MSKLTKREKNAISNICSEYNLSIGTLSRLYIATFDNLLFLSVSISEEFLIKLQSILVEDKSLKGTEEKILLSILKSY